MIETLHSIALSYLQHLCAIIPRKDYSVLLSAFDPSNVSRWNGGDEFVMAWFDFIFLIDRPKNYFYDRLDSGPAISDASISGVKTRYLLPAT